MKTIYKYHLKLADEVELELPINSEILKLGTQYGDVVIWVLVDKEPVEYEKRTFKIYGTGHDIDTVQDLKYIGSSNGNFIWHIFEKILK